MMSRILATSLLGVCAAIAQTGSIGGVVYDAGTGTPMADASVFASPGGIKVTTDGHGRYTLHDLNPGQYTIHASVGQGIGAHTARAISLNAGQDIETVDFHLRGQGEIAGKVLDENKDPLPGIAVFLVAREYSLGELRYVFASMATTDDQGEFRRHRHRLYLIAHRGSFSHRQRGSRQRV
jgi:hypothetical protein